MGLPLSSPPFLSLSTVLLFYSWPCHPLCNIIRRNGSDGASGGALLSLGSTTTKAGHFSAPSLPLSVVVRMLPVGLVRSLARPAQCLLTNCSDDRPTNQTITPACEEVDAGGQN